MLKCCGDVAQCFYNYETVLYGLRAASAAVSVATRYDMEFGLRVLESLGTASRAVWNRNNITRNDTVHAIVVVQYSPVRDLEFELEVGDIIELDKSQSYHRQDTVLHGTLLSRNRGHIWGIIPRHCVQILRPNHNITTFEAS